MKPLGIHLADVFLVVSKTCSQKGKDLICVMRITLFTFASIALELLLDLDQPFRKKLVEKSGH